MSQAQELVEAGEQLPTNQNQSASMIQVIERAAMNPEVDIDKMERLLQMQERIFDRNAEQEFNAAMVALQKDLPEIVADKKNNQTNSKYASLDTVNATLKPHMINHGFSVSFGNEESHLEGHIRTVGWLSHSGGHKKRYFYDCPLDDVGIKGNTNKTNVHASASSTSYSQRYLLKLMFNLSIKDEDDDGNRAGGDTRSAMEIKQEFLDFMEVVREEFYSIAAVKSALLNDDYSTAKEAWMEVDMDTKKILWKAPTKGGIFTTEERAKMKSDEWSAA